jgi:hypothetical protein
LENTEKNEQNLWPMVITWANWKLLRELLRMSNLKKGALVAVGE